MIILMRLSVRSLAVLALAMVIALLVSPSAQAEMSVELCHNEPSYTDSNGDIWITARCDQVPIAGTGGSGVVKPPDAGHGGGGGNGSYPYGKPVYWTGWKPVKRKVTPADLQRDDGATCYFSTRRYPGTIGPYQGDTEATCITPLKPVGTTGAVSNTTYYCWEREEPSPLRRGIYIHVWHCIYSDGVYTPIKNDLVQFGTRQVTTRHVYFGAPPRGIRVTPVTVSPAGRIVARQIGTVSRGVPPRVTRNAVRTAAVVHRDHVRHHHRHHHSRHCQKKRRLRSSA